jgi:uncharacterized phage-associated protein
MAVEFNLDMDKVIAASIFIASKDSKDVPQLTMGKLLKLIFLADKYHLVRYGRPITGDRYEAMKDGPVPSWAYDLFKRQVLRKPFTEQGRQLVKSLRVDRSQKNPLLRATAGYDRDQLSKSDIAALEATIAEFGRKSFNQLRDITHHMVAWKEAWDGRGKQEKAHMKFESFFVDDPNAISSDVDEMIEDHHLRHVLAQP